jgi:NADPH-dependent curcumin reductase CurA
MAALNKQVLLASRPKGAVTEDNFRLVEVPVGKPGAARCWSGTSGSRSTRTCAAG